MEVLGGVSSTNNLQLHKPMEMSWKFPSTLTTVEGGRGILFPFLEYNLSEYFTGGLIRSMELTIGLH